MGIFHSEQGCWVCSLSSGIRIQIQKLQFKNSTLYCEAQFLMSLNCLYLLVSGLVEMHSETIQ